MPVAVYSTCLVREALADALERHAAAAERTAQATQVAGRGRAASEVAESALAAFSAVDDAVAAHRADALRAGAPSDLPAALVKQRQRQAAARQEADDAARAAALLDGEAVAARDAEASAAAAVAAASLAVRAEVAEGLVRGLRGAEAEAARFRVAAAALLDGLTFDQLSGFRLPDAIVTLPYDNHHAAMVSLSPIGRAEAGACWAEFARNLLEDPEALPPGQIATPTEDE